MPMDWREHIVSTPGVLRGKARIKGTRVPVSLVVSYLEAGKSDDDVMAEFPDLARDQIAACLEYSRVAK